jgi:glycosyltransferase involved in cell wall biosynthesis
LDLVFIESQAAGLAVVGPRAVAVPLVVADGVNGRLYDPLETWS